MRKKLFGILLPLIVWIASTTSHAGLIVEFESVQMEPGRVGSIDVYVRSSDGTDLVAQYNTLFRITRISGQGILEFQPTAEQSNSETLEPNYVFFGDSNDFLSTSEDSNKNELTQGDIAFVDVRLDAAIANRRLLGRLEMIHRLPADQLSTFAGAEYQVSLVRNTTFFAREDLNTLVPIEEASFTNFGTVTFAAVPEPSSALMLLVALYSIGSRRRTQDRGGCFRPSQG